MVQESAQPDAQGAADPEWLGVDALLDADGDSQEETKVESKEPSLAVSKETAELISTATEKLTETKEGQEE